MRRKDLKERGRSQQGTTKHVFEINLQPAKLMQAIIPIPWFIGGA